MTCLPNPCVQSFSYAHFTPFIVYTAIIHQKKVSFHELKGPGSACQTVYALCILWLQFEYIHSNRSIDLKDVNNTILRGEIDESVYSHL